MSENKELIAEAFKRHFTHFGFKKTSVDDIARELQISKKTIYQHFSTKEEIFYFIVSRVARQYVSQMRQDLEGLPSCREQMAHLIQQIFAEAKKWLKEHDAFEFKYKYEISELAFKEAYNDLLKEILQNGIARGEFRAAPLDITVRFINGIFSESMRLAAANPDLPVEEEVIQAVNRLLT